jgi:AcrR family transcriptional regulator
MKGPGLRAEKNRKKIVSTALELFQAGGIKKISVSDIARDAGVTPATVYNHFASKDVLVREAVKEWYADTLKRYQEVLRLDLPFEEKFQKLISFKSVIAGKMHAEFLLATTSDDPEIRDYLNAEYMPEVTGTVYTFFDEGRKQGYVSPDLSTETILRYSEIIRKGINAESDLSEEPEYTAKLLRELTPIVLYGIFGKRNE